MASRDPRPKKFSPSLIEVGCCIIDIPNYSKYLHCGGVAYSCSYIYQWRI